MSDRDHTEDDKPRSSQTPCSSVVTVSPSVYSNRATEVTHQHISPNTLVGTPRCLGLAKARESPAA